MQLVRAGQVLLQWETVSLLAFTLLLQHACHSELWQRNILMCTMEGPHEGHMHVPARLACLLGQHCYPKSPGISG